MLPAVSERRAVLGFELVVPHGLDERQFRGGVEHTPFGSDVLPPQAPINRGVQLGHLAAVLIADAATKPSRWSGGPTHAMSRALSIDLDESSRTSMSSSCTFSVWCLAAGPGPDG